MNGSGVTLTFPFNGDFDTHYFPVPIVHLHGGKFRLTWIEYHNRWLRVSYFKFFYVFVCPKSSKVTKNGTTKPAFIHTSSSM